MHDTLRIPLNSLLIFIDETGNEDFSDPNNPTFGRGGCGALYVDYKWRLKKPWRRLKRERLGGASKPFHAVDLEQTRPTRHQIAGINAFMSLPFWRFAAMCDSRTALPAGIDGHKAISLVTISFFSRFIAKCDVDLVALIFESSDRGNTLVERDYEMSQIEFRNIWGRPVAVEGCFMPKTVQEPGLEIADLIAHTAGRQRRHEIAGKTGHTLDFQATYLHSHIPPEFLSITDIGVSEAKEAELGAPRQ